MSLTSKWSMQIAVENYKLAVARTTTIVQHATSIVQRWRRS